MSVSAPLVTVITAVKNGAPFLPDAIASVVGQTLTDWEYIVVDDASTDGTRSIVRSFAEADSRIRLLERGESGGPYVAANSALEVARGEYIARLDADDISLPDRLETQLEFLLSSPFRACGSHSGFMHADGSTSEGVYRVPVFPGVLRWWLTAAGGPFHSSLCVERAALDAVGGYRELPLAADRWLWCELSRRGWLGVVPQTLVARRRHSGQIGATKQAQQLEVVLEAAQHHLEEMTGRRWSLSEASTLHRLAHKLPVRRMPALRVLARWASHWARDGRLAPGERRRLAYIERKWLARALARSRP
jgi:glycosyltransferase involved in cell wall biosynthesis